MSALDPVSPGFRPTPPPFTETAARSAPGVPVLLAGIVALLAAIGLFTRHPSGADRTVLVVLGILLVLAAVLAFAGLTPVVAGQARVVQLFGRYRGTVRDARPVLGQPVHPPARGLDPDPQPRDRAGQGQRRRRQPDRDRRRGRLAGPGHRPGPLLGR